MKVNCNRIVERLHSVRNVNKIYYQINVYYHQQETYRSVLPLTEMTMVLCLQQLIPMASLKFTNVTTSTLIMFTINQQMLINSLYKKIAVVIVNMMLTLQENIQSSSTFWWLFSQSKFVSNRWKVKSIRASSLIFFTSKPIYFKRIDVFKRCERRHQVEAFQFWLQFLQHTWHFTFYYSQFKAVQICQITSQKLK